MTDLVISKESRLLGVFAGFATTAGCRVDLEIVRIRESEGAAVGRHADDHLLFGRAKSHPQRGRVIYAQLFLPLRVQGRGVQGRVVTGLSFPLAVEVVRHQIYEVQIAAEDNIASWLQ